MKLVREPSKTTNLCFSPNICKIDAKDIDEKIIEINSHLQKNCTQQNLDIISVLQKWSCYERITL